MRKWTVGTLSVVLGALAACGRATKSGSETEAASDAAEAAGGTGGTMTSDAAALAAAAAARRDWRVTPDGIGMIQTGWTSARVSTALRTTVKPSYRDTPGCTQLHVPGMPDGTLLMFVADTLMRVDVTKGGVRTPEGVGVGDAEAKVVRLYAGRAKVEPHKYTGPTGHYVTVTPPDDTLHRIIFETDGKTVLNYRAGRRPAVEYVEGCN